MSDHADQPLDWANEPHMSPVDALMWRGDTDRRLRGTISMLEIYDCVPDWDRLIAAHEWGSRMAPRFRQRVVDSPFGTGTPSWAVDPDFDLHYHVRRIRLAGDGSYRELLSMCEQLAMTALDPARPPWEGTLIEGLPDGKAAYFLKAHHALTDGLGAILGLAQLHSTSRDPIPGKPQPPNPDPVNISALDVLGRQFGEELQRLPHRVDTAFRGVLALTRPRRALSEALRYGRSVPRVAGLVTAPGSPLLAERSVSWRFTAFEVPFEDLKAAGKAARASVNDVYLAGLIGGFRFYHDKLGQPVEAIPVAIPISVRRPEDPAGGNRIAVGRMAGPVGIADPFERVLTIREQVRAARTEPAVDIFNTLGSVLAWLPGQVLAQFSGATTMNDLQASNVPGIPWDTYVAGAKVERMFPFGPLPGCAVMATMITHNGIACLGVNQDGASITDVDLFSDCLVEGFNEVLALGAETRADAMSGSLRRVV
ncbi:wax ester/triacylglycerol synthase domain-containing protein [Gordonia insulae]|uniref:diacylglycerol O-acyltransferase n=1 Tax=Gordonia insulae TaxID=2420509 RepID=A0A3G8JRJ7_9ACTN|nr:wax ester/triacylglycerol synthase domain-containing protein [Gordonia insulae]AZG47516.1 Putative diacylglycerol O-acyltransferase [Gordonia insulae]